ncbi:MAG: cysteine synthase family protein, partial [Armatimonadetes bacterium]|nr:cysteine synthase family protein [Armatimonadota bacterium]
MAASNILDRIGNTPLLALERIGRDVPHVRLYAKAEWFNPGGSVKDRPAANIVRNAEAAGLLGPGKTLLDATSGNTGIAYAMIGAARGFPVQLCMPENASVERKRILRAYGAELVLTSPFDGSDGTIREVRRRYGEAPHRYFYADQYSNENNWLAHYHSTAVEIWEQTEGSVTHWIAGLGTSGTFVGTTRRLREFNPGIRCISFQPDDAFHGLEGMKHMATAIVPPIYDPELADEDRGITTEAAHEMVRRLAREEGLLVGVSSGAALACTLQI